MSRVIEEGSLLRVLFTSACCRGKVFYVLDIRKQFSIFLFYGLFGVTALRSYGPKFSHCFRFMVAVVTVVILVSFKGRVYS